MRALKLDYCAPRAGSAASLGLLACGAALAMAGLWQFQSLQSERAGVQAASAAERAGVDRASRTPVRRGADAVQAAQQVNAANAVIDRLVLPWGELFNTFELAGGGEIALLSIEPDPARRTVKVTAESRTPQAMLDYLRQLQGAPLLDDVLLQKHELRTGDPERPVRFVITATWKDAA